MLYRNVGATHSRGASVPVFRGGAWTHDTKIFKDDVFAPTPVELARVAYKLRPVDPRSLPPQPDVEAAAVEPEPEPAPEEDSDPIDIELYRVPGTDQYDLPMGEIVDRDEALRLMGVDDGDPD